MADSPTVSGVPEPKRPASSHGRLVAGAALVGGLSVIGTVGGALRDLVIAARFGAGGPVDTFLVASGLTVYTTGLFGGSLATAFVPEFVAMRDRTGVEDANHLLKRTTGTAVGLLTAAAAANGVLAYVAIGLIAPGFSSEQRTRTYHVLLLLLPSIVVGGITLLWGGVLNATERFVLPALAPTVRYGSFVLALLAFATVDRSPFSLALATLASAVGEALVLGAAVRHRRLPLLPSLPNWRYPEAWLRGSYVPLLLSTVFMSANTVIDQAFASRLGPGSVAVLSYGNRVVGVILTIGATSLGTVALPLLSRLAANAEWKRLRDTVHRTSRLVLASGIPVALILAAFSRPIVHVIFEHGAFTSGDTERVASVQRLYLLQIPFYVLTSLFARALVAVGATRLLLRISIVAFLLNLTLDAVLSKALGVSGIALSTSGTYAFAAGFTYVILRRRTSGLGTAAA